MNQPPRIALAIPTFQREQVLVDVLENVLAQSALPDEIIVADQTPQHDPGTQIFLQRLATSNQIKLLHLPEPSLTAARNEIIKATSCDFIIFIDDDVVLPHDYVARYQKILLTPGIALATGPILPGIVGSNPSEQLERHQASSAGASAQITNSSQIDQWVRGGNFAVRKSAAVEIEGFDENFVGPAHGEEGDFARRLLRNKQLMLFAETLPLVHLKVPYGGCRVPRNGHWDEWQKPMNLLLLNFRYPQLSSAWFLRFYSALRNGPLLKENLRFTRFVPSFFHFGRAFYEAGKRRSEIKSSMRQLT
ncbi:MAG: putative glycosyltransferase [Acidobacteriaceae bacterium]|nr:putative glycosyltransferase [Acidobacteriaceae bacterium]